MRFTPRSAARHAVAALAVMGLAAGLVGCVAETSPGPSGPSPAPSNSGFTVEPTPIELGSPTPGAEIALPASCEKIYSPAMLSTLNAQTPPLNDPGVTMLSTQVVEGLEVLSSGAPTIRCSWGTPSESGMSTNVTIVTADQAATVAAGLRQSGFACTDASGGTLCTASTEQLTQDDTIVKRGESHLLRGNAWVATSWITVDPDGYMQDIAATLWG